MTPRWGLFLGFTGLLVTVVLVLARASQSVVFQHIRDNEQSPDNAVSRGPLLANLTVTQGLVAGLLIAAAWYCSIPPDAFGIGWVGHWTLILGIGVGVFCAIANEVGATVAADHGLGYNDRLRRILTPETRTGWLGLFGIVLPTVAVTEELLFRGALIGVTHVGFGTSSWALAIISSGAFAVGHGAQGRAGIAVTGLLGFVLAVVFIYTGSLIAVIIAHYIVNAVEFGVHETGVRDRTGPT